MKKGQILEGTVEKIDYPNKGRVKVEGADRTVTVKNAIPGQEEDNANFLISHNMAIPHDKSKNCAKEIISLLEDSRRLEAMRESCGSFDKSASSRNIFSLLNELTQKSGQEKA